MKLKTSLTVSRDGSLVDATDENLIHDADAAHATMQAMDEVSKYLSTPDGYASAVDSIAAIRQRASELMRSWGFDSGEVDSER